MFGSVGPLESTSVLITITVLVALVTWPAARILRRLGFSPWLAPLAAIPPVNLALLYFVAFSAPPGGASNREPG